MTPKILGLTGGIGSGKSTVAEVLKLFGFPLYKADDRAKAMYFVPEVAQDVIQLLGDEAYVEGKLNRAFIAEIVFNDKEKLDALNAIIHPAVKRDFTDWLEGQHSPLVIREAAILFESGTHVDCNWTLTVSAPESIRVDRVMKRDQATLEQVTARIKNQWTDEQRKVAADFEIFNFEPHLIIPQVERMLSHWDL